MERVLSLLQVIPLSKWQLCLHSCASSQVKHHHEAWVSSKPFTSHQRNCYLSPFGQMVSIACSKACRRTRQTRHCMCVCWLRSFFFFPLSIWLIIWVSFSRIDWGLPWHSPALSCCTQCSLVRLIQSLMGRWIFLNSSNSPDGSGSRIQVGSIAEVPNFPQLWLAAHSCLYRRLLFPLLTLKQREKYSITGVDF